MYFLILALVVSLLVLAGFAWFNKNKTTEEPEEAAEIDPNCCGAHEVCENDLVGMTNKEGLYFEDEDLDRFKEREERSYEDSDIEEFRDILYTLKRNEISMWLSSLEYRNIGAPSVIKDEALLLLED